MTKYPSVSVIVPCLNGKKIIANLIKSIEKQNYSGKIEIIVTDDGSTDGTSSYLKSKFPKVTIITFTKNRGSAPALNAAAKMADGTYLLATNDDVVFDKNAFTKLVDCAKSQDNVGITTGKMLDARGKFAIPGFRINQFLGYHPYDLHNKNKIRETDWAVGACLLIKKDLFQKLKGFDEKFIFCGEEYDLSYRVRQLGLKILYTPKAIFYHAFKRNSNPQADTLFAHYRGKFRYMFKHGKIYHLLVFLPMQLIIIPILYLMDPKNKHKILPIYKAFLWNLKNR